jgi:hypothetical protein
MCIWPSAFRNKTLTGRAIGRLFPVKCFCMAAVMPALALRNLTVDWLSRVQDGDLLTFPSSRRAYLVVPGVDGAIDWSATLVGPDPRSQSMCVHECDIGQISPPRVTALYSRENTIARCLGWQPQPAVSG